MTLKYVERAHKITLCAKNFFVFSSLLTTKTISWKSGLFTAHNMSFLVSDETKFLSETLFSFSRKSKIGTRCLLTLSLVPAPPVTAGLQTAAQVRTHQKFVDNIDGQWYRFSFPVYPYKDISPVNILWFVRLFQTQKIVLPYLSYQKIMNNLIK